MKTKNKNKNKSGFWQFWRTLGPGVITGASDDDPSGITTYTQAGAKFGFATLWVMLITFPLMVSIQEMCARIGLVAKLGLAGVLRKYYTRKILYVMILFSFPAITLNIGANIAGMGAVANLLVPQVPIDVFSLLFTILLLVAIISFPYNKIAKIMKWFCLTLLLYIMVPFFLNVGWTEIFLATIKPDFQLTKEYLAVLVAILGTTISPYLFFWQASMEVEEVHHKHLIVDKNILKQMRNDVDFGMLFSNFVAYFIILTAGSVLFEAGITEISTVEQAANALRPLAGNLAYLFFAIGVIGTGFLSIPVLAGSLSYIMAETFNWQEGLDKKFYQAKGFYITIIVSLLIGLLIPVLGISPIKALLYSAIFYGITAPVLIVIILHICNNQKVMGKYRNGWVSNLFGGLAFLIMISATLAMFIL
ncbi:MAG: divalent metal cation transporter [Patescibacteria group bacterium]